MSSASTSNNKALYSIITLAIVTLGHFISVWLISKIKVPDIQHIEPTKPLEVKIINIEKPKPQITPPQPKKEQPKPKKEQPKPKPQPPKKVEIVEKPKPKIIPPKPAQQRIMQTSTSSHQPQSTAVDVPPVTNPPVVQNIPVAPSKPVIAESPPAPSTAPSKPEVAVSPVAISEGQLAWKYKPNINAERLTQYLKKADDDSVTVTISFITDVRGKIVSATVSKSSGIPALDQYVTSCVKAAKLKEYKPNGVPTPVKSNQTFLFHKSK